MKKVPYILLLMFVLTGCQFSVGPAAQQPTQQASNIVTTVEVVRTQMVSEENEDDDEEIEENSSKNEVTPIDSSSEKIVAKKVSGDVYPGYMLKYNTSTYDENVKKIQDKLNSALGYELKEDGYFGKETENAVKFVQEQNNVTVDGIVGPVTWNLIFHHIGLSNAQLPYGDMGEYPGVSYSYNTKKYDENVKKIQSRLNLFYGFDVAEDGYFGEQTEEAVKMLQEQYGLEVDGIVGPDTWKILSYGFGDE